MKDLFDGVDGIATSVDPSTMAHDPHGVDLVLDGEDRDGPVGPIWLARGQCILNIATEYGKCMPPAYLSFMAPARDPMQGRARADRGAEVGQERAEDLDAAEWGQRSGPRLSGSAPFAFPNANLLFVSGFVGGFVGGPCVGVQSAWRPLSVGFGAGSVLDHTKGARERLSG